MRSTGNRLDARHWRTVASWLAGIASEALLPLIMAGIAAAVVGAFILP